MARHNDIGLEPSPLKESPAKLSCGEMVAASRGETASPRLLKMRPGIGGFIHYITLCSHSIAPT
jgi:hypothetical protein